MTFESAAALPTVLLTAQHAVNLAGVPTLIGQGHFALVHSAAGGVGDMLCQILRIYGLTVVGIVGSQSKVRSCKANIVIDKSHEDWAKAARKHAPNGYRAVSYDLLSRSGRLIVYGFHSNLPKCDGSSLGTLSPLHWLRMAIDLARTPHFDPMSLTLDSKAVLGFNLSFFSDEIETGQKYLSQMQEWIQSRKIEVPPISTFDFSHIRQAHNALTSGQSLYYYLDATPTHSYMKMMYKYPQAEFPYDELRRVNFERKKDPMLLEYELLDTGIMDDDKYFDVVVEYAQGEPDDTLVQITAYNHQRRIEILHEKLGSYNLYVDENTEVIFCENDTHDARATFGALSPYKESEPVSQNETLKELGDFRVLSAAGWHAIHRRFETRLGPAPDGAQETGKDQGYRFHLSGRSTGHFKDGFHDYVIRGDKAAVSSSGGTKVGLLTRHKVAGGSHVTARLRLTHSSKSFDRSAFADFNMMFQHRREDADRFYMFLQDDIHSEERRLIHRQALAGMVWTKQLYYYDIRTWLQGDSGYPKPPSRGGRNEDWDHLYNLDVISMPDKWEYPWYATWDLAFHCLPLALQLRLLTSERFMHPNGQLPAYEWNFNDVNPPVHAWAVWRVFQMDRKNRGDAGDLGFLEELFHKMMLNFQWWVNRKDAEGRNIFQGGFLGLDNIGVVDRSQPFPNGGMINQSDGTSWMAFYSLTLMRMALELALNNPV
eukprot:g20170.t1